MKYQVVYSPEFRLWFEEQTVALQDKILRQSKVLEAQGPQLHRPYVDTLKDSKLANLKELRIQYQRQPYHILFAFDPKRKAVFLLAGNKASSKRWYKDSIPLAEAIFQRYLATLTKE